jgi:hypothetical protein
MKKETKEHKIQFRISSKEYIFLQSLKEKNITMSKFIITSIKNTNRYKKFINIFDSYQITNRQNKEIR